MSAFDHLTREAQRQANLVQQLLRQQPFDAITQEVMKREEMLRSLTESQSLQAITEEVLKREEMLRSLAEQQHERLFGPAARIIAREAEALRSWVEQQRGVLGAIERTMTSQQELLRSMAPRADQLARIAATTEWQRRRKAVPSSATWTW